VEVVAGSVGGGEVDVVVTTPDDPTVVAVLDAILPAIGPDLGSVTLTRPVFGPAAADPTIGETVKDLSAAALFLSGVDARLVLLADGSADTLRRFALDEGSSLVVVLDRPSVAAELKRTVQDHGVWVLGIDHTHRRHRRRRAG
jgi:hypothetical protein